MAFIRGPGGYAIPAAPIPITYPDNDKVPEEAPVIPPPAYGLWRSSVRVNPDQFYWVRRDSDSSPMEPTSEEAQEETPPPPASPAAPQPAVRRPPSYSSEDGVSYVLAGPRPAGTTIVGGAQEELYRDSLVETRDSTLPGSARGSIEERHSRNQQDANLSRGSSPVGSRRVI